MKKNTMLRILAVILALAISIPASLLTAFAQEGAATYPVTWDAGNDSPEARKNSRRGKRRLLTVES